MDDLQLTPIDELEGYKSDDDTSRYQFSEQPTDTERVDFLSIKDRIDKVFDSFSREIDHQKEIFDELVRKATFEIEQIKESKINILKEIDELRNKCKHVTNDIETIEGLLDRWNGLDNARRETERAKNLVHDLQKNRTLLITQHKETLTELQNIGSKIPQNERLHALELALGIEMSCRDGCIVIKFSQIGTNDPYFSFKIENNRYIGVVCEPLLSDFFSLIDSLNNGMTFSQVCLKFINKWSTRH
ncbi:conserved Plasmodium protein, unknown function [Babesia microti strain RI]|uniref:Kinetochore protein SPC25 n=1 Tax=Babesia microti (strain RI) TaxID=1133968 RepID=A0A1N6LWM1_BABMR|nr:conserved Plasmodium protein, unknown function [Babesia microti strain RI]SIO73268.1 conserved Plasmodium protein, unknown function [Babesia microti strain RI]|eukprot:XP_021337373.1 conserved Plasmodium protein, unknown function [Babesia microti strain RI]